MENERSERFFNKSVHEVYRFSTPFAADRLQFINSLIINYPFNNVCCLRT